MPLAKHREAVILPRLMPASRIDRAACVATRDADEDSVVDTDRKVERHRYAKLLLQYVQKYQQFISVEVFVETLMQGLAVQEGVSIHTQALVATWAMKLLCNSSNKHLMKPIVNALFPIIYRNYDERKLYHASAAIQALVNDRNLIRDNPYFSHSTYMQDLVVSDAKIGSLSERLQRSLITNKEWKKFVVVLFQYFKAEAKKKAFLAWRTFVRKRRVDEMLRRNVTLRHSKNIRSLCLQTAFFRWKSVVEVSRAEYLTERLHQAAFQLEGAKSQFQMQCFRADKLQLSFKQCQEELRAITDERDTLRRQVAELSETLILREKEYQENMKSRVREVLGLVQEQRRTLKLSIDARFHTEEIAEDWIDEALNECTPAMTDTVSDGSSAYPQGHAFLLKWCNQIFAKERLKKPIQISNFASDFVSGESYRLILQYVFPDICTKPQPSLKATTPKTRLLWLCKLIEDTPLAIILEPEDFIHQREDKIAASIAEIFSYYIEEKRTEHSNAAYRLLNHDRSQKEKNNSNDNDDDDDDKEDSSVAIHDEESLKRSVREWSNELYECTNRLHERVWYETKLQGCIITINHEIANLVRERSKGQPVHIVTPKTGMLFLNLSVKNMEDLRTKFKLPNVQAWKNFLRGPLRNLLWNHIRLIERIFYHFAGDDARQMWEVQFWRFVEESELMIDPLSPVLVTQIFDTVISPQLAAMLRANAKDEKHAILVEMAQEEIDLRVVKPSQFTEILVRMAVTKYSGGIIEATNQFFCGLQTPKMVEISPATLSFYKLEAQNVIVYFQSDLARIFFFYMKQQLGESMRGRSRKLQGCGRFMSHLTHTTYLRIFADCGFLLPQDNEINESRGYQRKVYFISADEVLGMLESLHKRIPSIPPEEICFSIFLESLGLACSYWLPDPTVPLSRKLAAFLSNMIEKLRVVYAQDTLVLGAPPYVALEGGESVDLSR